MTESNLQSSWLNGLETKNIIVGLMKKTGSLLSYFSLVILLFRVVKLWMKLSYIFPALLSKTQMTQLLQ